MTDGAGGAGGAAQVGAGGLVCCSQDALQTLPCLPVRHKYMSRQPPQILPDRSHPSTQPTFMSFASDALKSAPAVSSSPSSPFSP